MNTKIFRFLCAAVLALACCCIPAAAFSGEPADWAEEAVDHLEAAGLVQPLYISNEPVSNTARRGYFLQMLVHLIQLEGQPNLLDAVSPMPADYFTDISYTATDTNPGGNNQMYYAAAFGLTEGSMVDGARVADCFGQLTREQAAKIMCSLLDALEQYAGLEPDQAGTARTFADQGDISPWALEYVQRASALGIMQGDEAGRFLPQGTLTWEEACVMVDRAYQAADAAANAQYAAQGISRRSTQLDLDAVANQYSYEYLFVLQNGDILHNDMVSYEMLCVESYHADGTSTIRKIPIELYMLSGFYESDSSYYLAFSDGNSEENDAKEVYRIVRYDKNWNRLGAASINGGDSYTIAPYGIPCMVEDNGTLIVHTARTRYLTSDGLNHQSNFTFKIRISDMSVISCSDVIPENHVSHSFAQYVAIDNGTPVYADQGDAYPRGFVLNVEDETGRCESLNFFRFAGLTGDNVTNAIPGGLGIAADNYLFAGASSPQQGNDSLTYANAFLAVIPKNDFPDVEPQIQWLTHYPADGKTYVSAINLVQINNNTFVVMWEERNGGQTSAAGSFCYAVFDGQGNQVGSTVKKDNFMPPSSTEPIVTGNRIIWARPETIRIQAGSYKQLKAQHIMIYALEITPNEADNSNTTYSLSIEPSSLNLALGESAELSAYVVGSDGSRQAVDADFDWPRGQGGVATVERDGVTILARALGTTSISGSYTWRGKVLTAECPVTVYQGEIALHVNPTEVTLHVGETVQLDIAVTGLAPGQFANYQSYMDTSKGLVASLDNSGRVTGYKEGTVKITVTYTHGTRRDPDYMVCHETITVTVLP